ncbi:MAG: response regulator [Planctomycetes bacterium]|nr:response regulator [Planctomycetota bacterium]
MREEDSTKRPDLPEKAISCTGGPKSCFFDSYPGPAYIIDRDLNIIHANRKAGDVFGIHEGGGSASPFPEADSLALAGSGNEVSEEKLCVDGMERLFLVSRSLCRDENACTTYLLVSCHDITGSRSLLEERIMSDRLQSLGLLAGGIAHDFNNILTGVVGNVQLLRMQIEAGEDYGRSLDGIEWAGRSAMSLTQQLLTFSRGGAPLRRITRIGELLRHTTRFALSEYMVKHKVVVPDDLWAVKVDKCQISHAINCLLVNVARKLNEGASITLFCQNAELDEGEVPEVGAGRHVRICLLSDCGAIGPDFLASVFDPQSSAEYKNIGIMTSCSIIMKHDGHVLYDEEGGNGRLSIYLPAFLEESEHAVEVGEVKPVAEGAGGKVLVMDNNPMIRRVAEIILQKLGFEPVLASDGAEAMELHRVALEKSESFTSMILDLTAEDGDGAVSLLGSIKEKDPDVKAIVTSGYCDNDVMENCKDYGFASSLAKPFTIETFSHALRQAIGRD